MLEKTYIEKVLNLFKVPKNKLRKCNYSNVQNHHSSCWPELYLQKHKNYFSNWLFNEVKNHQYRKCNIKMSINFKNLDIFEFMLIADQVILLGQKNITTYVANCSWGSFHVIDGQKFRNNPIDSVFSAIRPFQSVNSIPPLPPQNIQPIPSKKVCNGNSGLKFWNNGLNGIIGFKKLRCIANEIEKVILIFFRGFNGELRCLKMDSKAFETQIINEFAVEKVLNDNINAIKIYYNGIYYQPIIKQ